MNMAFFWSSATPNNTESEISKETKCKDTKLRAAGRYMEEVLDVKKVIGTGEPL
jgi:hypothetical protein